MSDAKENILAWCVDSNGLDDQRMLDYLGRSISDAAKKMKDQVSLTKKQSAAIAEGVDLSTTKMLDNVKLLIGYANLIRFNAGLPMFYELEEQGGAE